MKILFAMFAVFVVAFNVYFISQYGFTDVSQCSELGGIMVSDNTCQTFFGKVTFD